MRKSVQLTSVLVALSMGAFAQQFNGGVLNNATSKVYQPASIVGNYNLSVNAISVSGGLWNNGYTFTKDFLFSSVSNSKEASKGFFKNQKSVSKSASANLDIVGPSVSYNLGDAGYAGVYTRFREVVNLDRLNNGVFQSFNNLNSKFWNHTFSQQNLNISMHSFNEIGFNYGKEIYNENGHHLAAGITAKVLSGISAASVQVGSLNVNMSADTVNKLDGNFSVAYSDNAGSLTKAAVTTASQMLNFSGPKSVGADLGISYEYSGKRQKGYAVKASLAITDLGSITYKTSSNSKSFKVAAEKEGIEVLGFQDKQSPGQYLAQLEKNGVIDSKKAINKLTMKLPTALRGNVDYHVFSNLYVNADFIINVSKGGSTYTNTISLMPAYRTKWFSVGVPMTSNKLGGSSFGAYLQAGPLQLGSSTLLSNMAKEKIGNADLYAALSFNF